MRRQWPVRGLYAITPEEPDTRRLLKLVGSILEQGVALLQYRNKGTDATLRLEQALGLKLMCLPHDVPLIINDDIALARAVQADGVHLGEDDGDPAAAREELGSKALIGVSCHASIELAQAAKSKGADYLAFGAFFNSKTKPRARMTAPSVLQEAKRFGLPLAAIGGIQPQHVPKLRDAGADLIAVVSGIWSARDPAAAAHAYAKAFDPSL
ncbi:MAG TPA: thiamine phosphate synthase [Xanthomonadaceae bacterium]|jgi:thiamine-phosphate pyrophosphorylase|nr:thiamine phosphate synthase [Xanthomonadaceae bacterium]